MKKSPDPAEYPDSFNQLISEKVIEFGGLTELTQSIKSLHPPEPKKPGRHKYPKKAYYHFYKLVQEIYDNKLLYDEKIKRKASYARIIDFLIKKGNIDSLTLVNESQMPADLQVTLCNNSYYEQLTKTLKKGDYFESESTLNKNTFNHFKRETLGEFSKYGIKPLDWYIYHEAIPDPDASIAEQALEIKRLLFNDEVEFYIDLNTDYILWSQYSDNYDDVTDISIEPLNIEVSPESLGINMDSFGSDARFTPKQEDKLDNIIIKAIDCALDANTSNISDVLLKKIKL